MEEHGIIGRKGNCRAIAPGAFQQLEVKAHFPFDLMKKKILGYVNMGTIWILYEDEHGESVIRVPFARNRKWFEAIVSDPEFLALKRIPQIYVV